VNQIGNIVNQLFRGEWGGWKESHFIRDKFNNTNLRCYIIFTGKELQNITFKLYHHIVPNCNPPIIVNNII